MASSLNGSQIFMCVECDERFDVQIDFYNHLKVHYEPTMDDYSTSMEDSLDPDAIDENDEEESSEIIPTKKTTTKKKIRRGKVFNDGFEETRADESLSVDTSRIKTRCGRVSKPRTRDSDMIPFSPIVKEEPREVVEVSGEELDNHSFEDNLNEEQDDEIVDTNKTSSKKIKKAVKSRKPRDSSIMLKKVETERGVFKFECDICHKLYANSTSMTVHMRIHRGEKPFKCEQCDLSFRQYSDLMYHTASKHEEKKAFQCEFCGKDFSRKYSLTIHQKIHTGVRDYKCELCGKAFRASIYLQEHKRIHTGEKPYLCDLCGRGFRIKSDMHRHRHNVHLRNSRCAPIVKAKAEPDENYCEDDEEEIDVKDVVTIGTLDSDATTYLAISEGVDVEDDERVVLISTNNEAILVTKALH